MRVIVACAWTVLALAARLRIYRVGIGFTSTACQCGCGNTTLAPFVGKESHPTEKRLNSNQGLLGRPLTQLRDKFREVRVKDPGPASVAELDSGLAAPAELRSGG